MQLLAEGKNFSEIKLLNEQENIYSASTKARAQMIYSTVTARIKMLDPSFYPVFLSSDIATQKMFALVAALAHDTLFFDFVYQAGAKRESSSLSGLHAASAGSGIQNAALRGRNAGRKQGQLTQDPAPDFGHCAGTLAARQWICHYGQCAYGGKIRWKL